MKFTNRDAVVQELEKSYVSLVTAPRSAWNLNDKDYWMIRLKMLEIALDITEGGDVDARLSAIQERIDALKPKATVTSIRA